MASQSSTTYSLQELDRQYQRILELKAQSNVSRPLYNSSNADAHWQRSIQMRKERDALERSYPRGICRLFCDNFHRALPPELRDMVYDYIHARRKRSLSFTPATSENLEYYGHEVTSELAESFYRHQALSAYIREPPLQDDMFDEDLVGVAPANVARSLMLTLWKTPAISERFKLVVELETSVNHTIEELMGCVENYFRALKALHEKGSTVSISMDIGRLEKADSPGPLANSRTSVDHYVFLYPVTTATFEDFTARLKREATSIGIQI
ncbi:hypothetical protein FB567DRAFT_597413 [Paraphoma chrysanthemicola]|uniref:Uncharacterized protein n=1 Tax=Paraphoma chrysanthemicola TaxID=798071 RepID=A0A8K0VU97_9PLEO|nr:hypothetical protein FB567DRAFT_597413 [Paraphoma chrysanthemicola]